MNKVQINETVKIEKVSVILQRGIDFNDEDLELGEFASQIKISEDRLQEIAKFNGFDKCSVCKCLTDFNQEFVNAKFIKNIE